MTSPRARAFAALIDARFREFFRESEAVFWTFVFPVVLTVVLALAFRNRPVETLKVAVTGAVSESVAQALEASGRFDVRATEQEEAFRLLRLGKIALIVLPLPGGGVEYRL